MPLYENECERCGHVGTHVRSIDERDKTPRCSECGGKTHRIVSAVRGFADIPEYVSPATGKVIRGRRQREEDFRVSGCRPYEGTESEMREAKRIRADIEKKREKKLDELLDKTIEELHASNRLTRTGERKDPLPDDSDKRKIVV